MRDLESKIPKSMEKLPKVGEYNGKGYLDKHIQLINERLSYLTLDETSKFKIFSLDLAVPAILWFNNLPNGSIKSWINLSEKFSVNYTSWKRRLVIEATLSGIILGKKESM